MEKYNIIILPAKTTAVVQNSYAKRLNISHARVAKVIERRMLTRFVLFFIFFVLLWFKNERGKKKKDDIFIVFYSAREIVLRE